MSEAKINLLIKYVPVEKRFYMIIFTTSLITELSCIFLTGALTLFKLIEINLFMEDSAAIGLTLTFISTIYIMFLLIRTMVKQFTIANAKIKYILRAISLSTQLIKFLLLALMLRLALCYSYLVDTMPSIKFHCSPQLMQQFKQNHILVIIMSCIGFLTVVFQIILQCNLEKALEENLEVEEITTVKTLTSIVIPDMRSSTKFKGMKSSQSQVSPEIVTPIIKSIVFSQVQTGTEQSNDDNTSKTDEISSNMKKSITRERRRSNFRQLKPE